MKQSAFMSYAGKVDAYVAGRPEYPPALLSELPDVDFAIDLGAGTGISTEMLTLKAKRVLAVEPVAEMARKIPVDRLPAIQVAIASAEAIPAPDGSAGLVMSATAFHWFDYDAAAAEIVRVLAPGGSLALLWNIRDGSVPWVARFDAVMDACAGDTPRQSTGKWRRIFSDPRFEHVASKSYQYTQPMPSSGIVARAMSTSFVAALDATGQERVRGEIEAIVASEPSLAGGGPVAFPYVTELHLFLARA
ncbi:MAG: class I SAM-dependent methyltransferase [Hyphomicrobiaceae bacterium]